MVFVALAFAGNANYKFTDNIKLYYFLLFCMFRQTEEQIGLMKNHVRCLVPDCTTEYALESLKEVLGK
jgi:hypothetical protein